LQEAAAPEVCKHGEYMKWVKKEFGWSHQTVLNYRYIYQLSQNPNILEFDKLDISITALLYVAHYMLFQPTDDQGPVANGMAVIEAARKRRISFKEARKIIETLELNDEEEASDDGDGHKNDDDKPEPEPEDEEPAPEPDDEEPEPEPAPDDDESSDDEADADEEPDDDTADFGITAAISALFNDLRRPEINWLKVIEAAGPSKISAIIDELTRKLDQYKASQPPEPTTRVKLKQKESLH
jgi:hypothetical protein